ncbi:MAG: hypothetical protein QM719_02090 [Thermomonas sp.]
MNRVPDPLDADERTLADLLARDTLPGPSPQLDARILAAARAATSTTERASRRPRPRPRWIAGMSIAATLVLAVGLAWRLRPLPERHAASEAPTMVSAVRVVEPAESGAASAAAAQPRMEARRLPMSVPMPPRERVPEPARKQAPPEPPVVFDEPSPMDVQAPPPAPPPPPAPAMAPNPAAKGMAAPAASAMQAPAQKPADSDAYSQAKNLDRVEVTGSRLKTPAPPSPPQAFSRDAPASGMDAAAAANAAAAEGVSRAVLDEEPPATADSPQVQEAWLQRIRELLSAGETEAARNSLAEFRRRYPKYALPEDLRRFATP